jgi:hypothetical protein
MNEKMASSVVRTLVVNNDDELKTGIMTRDTNAAIFALRRCLGSVDQDHFQISIVVKKKLSVAEAEQKGRELKEKHELQEQNENLQSQLSAAYRRIAELEGSRQALVPMGSIDLPMKQSTSNRVDAPKPIMDEKSPGSAKKKKIVALASGKKGESISVSVLSVVVSFTERGGLTAHELAKLLPDPQNRSRHPSDGPLADLKRSGYICSVKRRNESGCLKDYYFATESGFEVMSQYCKDNNIIPFSIIPLRKKSNK